MTAPRVLIRRVIVPGGIAGAVVAGLIGVGILAGVGPLQWVQRRVAPAVAAIGLVQLVLVGAFLTVGVWVLRASTPPADRRRLVDGPPPGTPRQAPRLVGAGFDAAVADAIRDVRLKDTAYSDTSPQQTLSETAHDVLTLVEGDAATAEQALETGAWTSDPIAAAFLSDAVAFPASFQLLRWATPGVAYERAVEHTTSAITQTLADSAVAAPATPQPASPPQGVLARLQHAVQTRMAAVDADAAEAINDVRDPSAADTHPAASTPTPTEPQPSATPPDATQGAQESAQDPAQEPAEEPAQEDEHV